MRKEINKKEILEILESSGFMLGVNKGFHESPLPTFAVKGYSDLDKLKSNLKKDDMAIAHDLGLRLGTQALSKATIGGLVFTGAKGLQHIAQDNGYNIDPSSDSSFIAASIPAVAAAWYGSDKASKYIPHMHKKIVSSENSIYK